MKIKVQEKKKFLNWLVSNVSFNRREVSWILNYLANHEAILTNVHFVEKADRTNRGLCVRSAEVGEAPVVMIIDSQKFQDTDQIFHEIRLNWKSPLYLECFFPKAWENDLYLAVLEDNPFYKWNDTINPIILQEIESYLDREEQQAKIDFLYHQIDLALENHDRNAFFELSDEVNRQLLQSKQRSH